MPVHTKITGEHTRPTNAGTLCSTCRYVMLVRGTRLGDDRTICKAGLGPVRFDVTECSMYDDERKTPVWQLEHVAWIRMEDRKGRVRFISPIERAKHKLDDD